MERRSSMQSANANIARVFFKTVAAHPEQPALIHHNTTISFKELENELIETAAYYRKRGIGKGDRVLVFVPMGIDLYRVVLALFSLGATAVFLDEWVGFKRMEICCKIADCKGFIGIPKARVLRWFSPVLRKIPLVLSLSKRAKWEGGEMPVWCSEQDTALITFTTGSTGTPKAANRTHGFLLAQFEVLKEHLQPLPYELDMPVLPILVFCNLAVGNCSLICDYKSSKPQKFKPEKILNLLSQHKVNSLTASPYFIKRIAEEAIKQKRNFPALRKIVTGGAPVFPAEAQLFNRAFVEAEIQVLYGSTEAEPISSISTKLLASTSLELHQGGLPVGKKDGQVDIRIIPITEDPITIESGQVLKECAPKEIGEIVVAGRHVLTQYFNNEEAFRQNKIQVGNTIFHRTGDSGFLDADENVFLTGRCKSLIYERGILLSPFLYENYFQTLPGVTMGTILKHDNKIFVLLEVKDSSYKQSLLLELHKLPLSIQQICFLKIPRDPRHHAKIDYDKLKGKLAQLGY